MVLLLVGCSAPWGYAVGLGVKARSREMLKQMECLLEKKKLAFSATAGVIYGSWRRDFLSSPEAWK